MSAPVMIDTPRRRLKNKGIVYEAKFWWAGDDPETVLPKLGTSTALITTARNNRVVESYSDALGNSAHLLYISVSTESDDGTITDPKSKEDFAKSVNRRMSIKEIHLDPKWWGMRIADKVDAGKTPFKTLTPTAENKIEYSYYLNYYNVKSLVPPPERANEGDLIFRNAIPEILLIKVDKNAVPVSGTNYYQSKTYLKHEDGDISVGSTDTFMSPYVGPTDDNFLLAGKRCKTFVYQVTYYNRKKFNTIGMFAGINGTFGKGCDPFDKNTARWHAIEQQVEDVKDADGDVWSKITRSMELAPGTWTFDVTKIVHGTWTW